MKMPAVTSPGSATRNAKRLMRRSYSNLTRRRGGLRALGRKPPCELEPILLHPPVECSATQPQSFRRLTHIALKTLQSFSDQNRFHRFQAEVFKILALWPQQVEPEVATLDFFASAHQDSALDRVIQLAYVSRPGILHQ